MGVAFACLTRGYGRNSAGRLVVSDNDGVLSDVNAAGDEPFLLAENLRGRAAVICDKNRVATARWAIENLGSEIFILDDAFQHQQIQRSVNILIIDATNPFGSRRLLPAGILREPISESKRADCFVITRASESGAQDQLRAYIKGFAGAAPIFTSDIELAAVRSLNGNRSVEDLTDRRVAVAAFCGIGNPNSFFALLRRKALTLPTARNFATTTATPKPTSIRIVREASARGAQALVTTTKDAVKLSPLRFEIPCYVVDISMRIEEAEEFFRFVNESIQR